MVHNPTYYEIPRNAPPLPPPNPEHRELEDEMKQKSVNIQAKRNTDNNAWSFIPDANSVSELADFMTENPKARNEVFYVNIYGDARGRTNIPPIRATTDGVSQSSSRTNDREVLNWLHEWYIGGAIPIIPDPEMQIYRQIYRHEKEKGILTDAVRLNATREFEQWQRKNLTESELSRFVLSTGVIEGKTEKDVPAPTLEEITEVLKLDTDIWNPRIFQDTFFTIRDKMNEHNYSLPAQELILGSLLHVHLFDRWRYILFANDGTFTVETNASKMNTLGPTEQDTQRAGDVEWTETLNTLFWTENVHQNPVELTRWILANSRNMRLQELRKKSAMPNENILRNLSTKLDGEVPKDPNNPSRSEEIAKSNLEAWEKTFLSLTYAVHNDVIKNADDDQRKYFDNAIWSGNAVGPREAVANFVHDPWAWLNQMAPLLAVPWLIYIILKLTVKEDKWFLAGVRKFFGGLALVGLIWLGYKAYKDTLGTELKKQALWQVKEPERTPKTAEKKINKLKEWQAQWNDGKSWVKILESVPELTKPKDKGGFAIGDLMVALHPGGRDLENLQTSDEELVRVKTFVQDFERKNPAEKEHLKNMVEEIWRSNQIVQGDSFEAQDEKWKTVWEIWKYVDNEENFFNNALQGITGDIKDRRMFATYIEYRKRMQDVPMGDILHIFNEDVPWATISNPVTNMSNFFTGKIDVSGINKSPNYSVNQAKILGVSNWIITDEGRLYLRMLFNTIWREQQKNGTNDESKTVGEIVVIERSVL